MIKTNTVQIIDVQDWDKLVEETYGKIYSFQQQDGCKDRGTYDFEIPNRWGIVDYENESIPEIINGDEMGVSFTAWLKRDPKSPLNPTDEELKDCSYYWGKSDKDKKEWKESISHINMFWQRNFYPDVSMIIEDFYKKGLIKEGKYSIKIDW